MKGLLKFCMPNPNGISLLHFYAISVSSLCFLVTTQYVSYHKKIQCSSSCESSGNWTWCFWREIALKCINVNPVFNKCVKEAEYVLEISCTEALMVSLYQLIIHLWG